MVKAKEIILLPIEQIKPWPKNPNKHSKDQIERLAKLIKYQGFRNPLIISKRSGFLIVGHGRLEAAKHLGLKELPCLLQDYDSGEQEYAHCVADNAIADWAELDLSSIIDETVNFSPNFDLELLGLKDFSLDGGEVDLPDLAGQDPGFQQRTFILSNEQADILDDALDKAKKAEDCTDELNQNKNGNTLASIMKRYVYG